MRRVVFHLLIVTLVFFSVIHRMHADAPEPLPTFNEVYNLIRTNLHGVSAAEIDHAAAEGLLAGLGPRVTLLTNGVAKAASVPLISRARVLEDNVAYIRAGTVGNELAQAVVAAHGELCRTAKVVGVVLDLRFADGDSYPAAAEVAGLFLKSEMALLDWGNGLVKTQPASPGVAGPVVVLVNRQTSGAAEALAAALREAGVALIIGAPTAGLAAQKQTFTLKDGGRLRIATSPVKLANGTTLSPQPVQPDIEVVVGAAEEKAVFADPYRGSAKAEGITAAGTASSTNRSIGTNRLSRRLRPTEADLVRARREGLPLEGELVTGRETEPSRPELRDPALARAVDLLKGLAVVRAPRS